MCEYKNLKEHHVCEKDYIWDPSMCICKNGKYLGCIIGYSVIRCDQIINPTDIATTVTSTVSANFHHKKVRYKINCYTLHTVLLVVILLFIISIICYHYDKHRSK